MTVTAEQAYENPRFWRAYNQLHAHDARDAQSLTQVLCPRLASAGKNISVLILGVGTGTVELPVLAGLQELLPDKSFVIDCVDRSEIALGILAERLQKTDWGHDNAVVRECDFFNPQVEIIKQIRSRRIDFNLLKQDIDRLNSNIGSPGYNLPSEWHRHPLFEGKRYHLVIAAFSLMQMSHWDRVMQQIMRFLGKGGVFIHPKALGDEVIWELGTQRYRNRSHAEHVFLDVVYRSPEANAFTRQSKGITAGRPGPISRRLDDLVTAGFLRHIKSKPSYCYSAQPIAKDTYAGLLKSRGFGLFRKLEAAVGTTAYDLIVDEVEQMRVTSGAFDHLNLDLHWDVYQMKVDSSQTSLLVGGLCSQFDCDMQRPFAGR